ncbi:exocyst complex component SEC10a-like [Rutidosis leptorrhynchoides]|uniref:exocyst complex component SEC10a-like n=1 Tax=Rutidosis leptorrhynchoides TaxID=125765 RepID=UPI003A992F29
MTQDESKGESLVLDIEQFKGDFSYDALFANVVNELLPSFVEEDVDLIDMSTKGLSSPLFPEVDTLLLIFKDSSTQLAELRKQIDKRLQKLKKEVVAQDSKHRKTLGELEKGVDGIFKSFARLDSRISSVGQTAAKIGDHLQSADSQRETASQTLELIKYLMEFNSSQGDLIQLSSLFSDDKRVAEAASIAQKLRSIAEEDIGRHGVTLQSGNATASKGLEVAVTNLQEYCNELENKLLSRFDSASQRRELTNMAECAKILSQFNRGTSAMQHYVGLRPMFDVEVMNEDSRLVLGDQDSTTDPVDVNVTLSELYKKITDTVRKESATIRAVFPCPNDVMSILVQRVMEDRIPNLLEKLLVKPSLVNPPLMKQGGLLQYLRRLAVGYERTQELAKDLRDVGCGDLDVEGLTEALFSEHKDIYLQYERASMSQLYKAKIDELHAEGQLSSKGASISVTVVTEFVSWNEEAISRCKLFSHQPANLAANAKAVFTCLLDQVRQYTTEGLERAREGLREAASQRERFVLGRKVASGASSAAEAAGGAGENSFRSFMLALQGCGSSVAIIQQYFSNSISRLLLPVDGAHAATCEEMAAAMSSSETSACRGLQQCIEIVITEVERLLSSEQKATDFKSLDDGLLADPRPTAACSRVVSYLSRVLESAFTALEGLNKQSFLTELGNRLHKAVTNHWLKFSFNASGGLKLKRDITEYGDFIRNFNTPTVDEKFESLSIMANIFIVAPESLASLIEGTPSIKKEAQRFVQLRDDYRSAKLASKLHSVWH